jgi:hypothetical protein
MNAYSKLELSAYGAGTGGGGGGGIIETVYGYGNLGQTFNNSILTDTFNAYTINQINTRLVAVESGSALTVNTTGIGNAITSISKSGTVITASKDLTFSLSNHLHTGVYEPVFTKNNAFNKNFGTTAGTVAQGNDSRIINGQTAFGWGNHSGLYLPLSGGTMSNTNLVTNLNADLLDGYHSNRFALQGAPAISTDFLVWDGATLFGLRAWTPSTPNYPGDPYGTALDFKDAGTWYHRLAFGTSGRIRYYNGINTTTLTKRGDLAFTTDNVASATKLQTARTVWGQSFDGTGNVTGSMSTVPQIANGGVYLRHTPTSHTILSAENSSIYLRPRGDTDIVGQCVIDNLGNLGVTGTVTAPTFIGALNGNAASATALQTARTIWGQSFNGEANVSGAMTGVTTIAMTGGLSGATTIQASISVTTPKVIFAAAGWSMEQVGSELQMKHNNVLKMRFTSAGSIVATEEITAFG